eukprot:260729_1
MGNINKVSRHIAEEFNEPLNELERSDDSDETITDQIDLEFNRPNSIQLHRKKSWLSKSIGDEFETRIGHKMDQKLYVAYQIHNSPVGLFKSMFQWTWLHLLLLVVIAPCLAVMLICHS